MKESGKTKMKLTKLEWYWILYDVGNSAYILLGTTLFPIYFNYLAEKGNLSPVDYLAYWGYATSMATLLLIFSGPILGTISDTKGWKKKMFVASIVVGVISCGLIGGVAEWVAFLIFYVISKYACSISMVLYDSMLADITTTERMDVVSTSGFAWGYIGSCIPFIMGLGLVLGAEPLGLSLEQAMMFAFLIVCVWWFLVSLPLIRNYKQKSYIEVDKQVVKNSLLRIGRTFKEIKQQKHIFLFLLAFIFYIDGVHTIINMSVSYGSALGLDSNSLLVALLVTQIIAFPACLVFGKLVQKYSSRTLISVCIIAYTAIAIFAYFMATPLHFWILAVCVGLFQGGIQGLSRSYFTKIIPAEKAGEYFGFYDICGKGAAFKGTMLMSVVGQVSGNINLGIVFIAGIFVIGFVLFIIADQAVREKTQVIH